MFKMIEQKYSFVLLSTVGFILISTCCSLYIEKAPARVLISEDRSVEDGYMVEIEANGETRTLRLTPMETIFSNDAQSLTITVNEKGEETYEYKSIPEIKVYHDSKVGSVLSLKEGKVNGILDSDYTIISENEKHFVIKSSKKEYGKADFKRVADNFPKMVYKRISKEENCTRKPVPIMMEDYEITRVLPTYTPEIVVMVDSKLASVIGTDTKCWEYLACFWNAVAKRFKTVDNIIINLRLVGSVIIRTSSGEPFITNNLDGEEVWGDECLSDESKWVYTKMSTLPAHDLIYLQTGRDLLDDDGSTGLGGIAYMGAVCVKNSGNGYSYSVGLGEDIGAFYDGVHIATHEVAHILGSPHDDDGEDGTLDCKWDWGYIMSYIAGSINHMFFSICSKSKMAQYLASSEATCCKSNLAQTTPPGVYNTACLPGNKISMDEQCKRITGHSEASVNLGVPEDSLCYNMQCTYPDDVDPDSGAWTVETYQSAPEGALCPSGGRCSDGKCVS